MKGTSHWVVEPDGEYDLLDFRAAEGLRDELPQDLPSARSRPPGAAVARLEGVKSSTESVARRSRTNLESADEQPEDRGLMDILRDVTRLLDDVLSLGGRGLAMTLESPLLGAVPELDSMAVVSLIAALEERFGIFVDDDDIDGQTFATVGSLVGFVQSKTIT